MVLFDLISEVADIVISDVKSEINSFKNLVNKGADAFRSTEEKIEADLEKGIQGKKIGILGLPDSGKTTLANDLVNLFADFPNYKNEINIANIKSNDGKPYHKKYDYSQEIDILHTSDIILYLFDITKLFSETEKDRYFKTIRKEIEVYGEVLDRIRLINLVQKIVPSQEKVFIPLGTHCDKLKDLKLTRNEIETQLAVIRGDLKKIMSHLRCCWWEMRFFCSLVDKAEDWKMVFELLADYYSKSHSRDSKREEEYDGFKFKVLKKQLNKGERK